MSFDPNNPPRDFKGLWIPKEIWLDTSLNLFQKALFAEINSLDGKDGCFADNKYFMNFFNVSERTLQEGFSILKKKKYIWTESFDGRSRVLRSSLKNVYEKFRTPDPQEETIYEKFRTPDPRNSAPLPHRESHRAGENNIENIKKKNNTKRKPKNATDPITYNIEKRKLEGISVEDVKEWQKVYTSVNIRKEIDKCTIWARDNGRQNYRKALMAFFQNAEKSHTEPFKERTEPQKEVRETDIQANYHKAQEWELKAEKLDVGGAYAIQATPYKVIFALPANQGYEVSYSEPQEEFETKCMKALKRMKLID